MRLNFEKLNFKVLCHCPFKKTVWRVLDLFLKKTVIFVCLQYCLEDRNLASSAGLLCSVSTKKSGKDGERTLTCTYFYTLYYFSCLLFMPFAMNLPGLLQLQCKLSSLFMFQMHLPINYSIS